MLARDSEWIRIAVGVGFHVTIMILFFRMSMFPGIGKSTNFILRNFAFFANHDFLNSLFEIPLFGIFFDSSDMLL